MFLLQARRNWWVGVVDVSHNRSSSTPLLFSSAGSFASYSSTFVRFHSTTGDDTNNNNDSDYRHHYREEKDDSLAGWLAYWLDFQFSRLLNN